MEIEIFLSTKRRFVTLLEMLIVMLLLSILFSVVGMQVHKAIREQRFHTEVSMVVDRLRLAQDLMLTLPGDITVVFVCRPEGKGIEYWLKVETPHETPAVTALTAKHYMLKEIQGVFFKDDLELTTPSPQQGYLEVKFWSKGAVMSQGLIRLAASPEDPTPSGIRQAYVALSGYPEPLVCHHDRKQAESHLAKRDDVNFLKMLRQDSFDRLLAGEQKNADSSKEDDG